MWPNSFFPSQPPTDIATLIRAQIDGLKGLEELAEKYVKEKKDKKEKENPKPKLPEIKLNIFELAFLAFAISPVWWLLFGGIWAKIIGIH